MRTLPDLASGQAQRRPDATAVVSGRRRVTYGELEAASNRLANLLVERGCRPGDRVCLFQPKGPAAIVGMLAVMKAGATYVPIDLSSPAPRVAKVVLACEPRFVLAASSAAALLDRVLAGIEDRPLVLAPEEEPLRADIGSLSPERPAVRTGDDAPAHILFTSGSTGVPKGVVITHRNVLHFVDWAVAHFGTAPGDRISGHPPLHFDLSTFDIYGTFAAGAQLHLVPRELNLLPSKLAEFIRSSELTQWFSVPSVLSYLAKHDVVRPGDFPSVRRILWCGEVLPTSVLVHWMRRVPQATFTNLYGPTEATIASSFHTVASCPEDETAPIPIGVPCTGERLLVLDEELREVPDGETGDLYIQGSGLSPGYWRDPDRTREVFLPSPFEPGDRIYRTGDLARHRDGLFHFVGRVDSQIKSRGYRIELGEIEAALDSTGLLREFAVVAVSTDRFEGSTICCAYAPAEPAGPAPSRIRKELAKLVPPYMLPSLWRAYDRLPQTTNGKTDRRALREEFLRDAT